MSSITIHIANIPFDFKYTLTKESDNQKANRYWDFMVTHSHRNLVGIPYNFRFRYDTLKNVMIGELNGAERDLVDKIMDKEVS